MPPQQNRSLASALIAQLGGLPTMMASESGIKDPNDVFVSILESRSIADSLISQYDLKAVYHKVRIEDLRESLSRATNVRSDRGGTIVVSVEDKDANRAAALANSYVSEMYKLNSHMAMTEGAQRRVFFEQQRNAAREELEKAEAEFKKTQVSSGIVQFDAQAKGLVEQTFAIETRIAAQEVQVRSLQPYLTTQNEELKRAQSELAALREQLTKLENHPRVSTMDVPVSELPSAAMEYANRLRDVKSSEEMYETIGKQYEIARLDEAKDAPLLQIIDSAVPPTKPFGPHRIAIVLVSMMSAFVIGVGCALAHDSYRPNPTEWIIPLE
jgi:uncharacterized protein involved in exopolysaccharide biosynthesis